MAALSTDHATRWIVIAALAIMTSIALRLLGTLAESRAPGRVARAKEAARRAAERAQSSADGVVSDGE